MSEQHGMPLARKENVNFYSNFFCLRLIDGCGKLTAKHDHMLTKIKAICSDLIFERNEKLFGKLKSSFSPSRDEFFRLSRMNLKFPHSAYSARRLLVLPLFGKDPQIMKISKCIIGLTWQYLFIFVPPNAVSFGSLRGAAFSVCCEALFYLSKD